MRKGLAAITISLALSMGCSKDYPQYEFSGEIAQENISFEERSILWWDHYNLRVEQKSSRTGKNGDRITTTSRYKADNNNDKLVLTEYCFKDRICTTFSDNTINCYNTTEKCYDSENSEWKSVLEQAQIKFDQYLQKITDYKAGKITEQENEALDKLNLEKEKVLNSLKE